ncbi:MAG: hypothetical protein U0821_19035 [Chloroflexota bacterium]
MARMGLRTAARRKLLAFGGLGALMGLARQPETAHAAHQAEDLGLGLANPTGGGLAPTTTTRLTTNVSGSGDAFAVQQQANADGDAMSGYGGSNLAAGNGGDGVYGEGGGLSGAFLSIRSGGVGVIGLGGNGDSSGSAGSGGAFTGGSSGTIAGAGARANGGQNSASPLAVGGAGLIGKGGFGSTGVTRTGVGVLGQSTSAEGVRGESGFGPGTLGVSGNGIGVYAVSHNNWGLFSQSPNYAGVFYGSVYIAGGLKLLGGFLAAVKHPDGSTRAAHGMTSADPLIEDVGRARLTSGAAHVDLEPNFAALVGSSDYDLFLTPYGDCNGLYVAVRTASGFDVRELKGGTATLDFGYRVVAKRRDGDRSRLAKLDHLEPLPAVTHTNTPEPPRDPKVRSTTPNGATPEAAPPPRR